jgi:AcrR family transcriptional regulator
MTLAPRRARLTAAPGTLRRGYQTRAQILDVAEELFANAGYNATSLAQVAEGVGITQPAVLYHFPSKDALLLGLLNERDEPALDDTCEGLAVIDALAELFRKSLTSPQLVRLFTVILTEGLAPDHPAHLFVRDRYEEAHDDILRRLKQGLEFGEIQPDADIASATSLAMATMDGLSIQWLLDPSLDVASTFERFVARLRADLAVADPDSIGYGNGLGRERVLSGKPHATR